MEETKSRIYDIEVNATEAVKMLAELKNLSGDLDKRLKEVDVTTEKGAESYYELASQLKAVNAEAARYQRQVINNIKEQNKNEGSLARMRLELSRLKEEWANTGDPETQKRINSLTTAIKEQEESIQVYSRNVGNYENALSGVFDGYTKDVEKAIASSLPMGDALISVAKAAKGAGKSFSALGTAIKGVGKKLLTLLANPVFAALAVAASAVMLFTKALNSSEDATNRWNAVLAPLRRSLDFLLNLLQKGAGHLLSFAEGVSSAVSFLGRLAEKLPLVGRYIKEVNDANREAIQIERDKASLAKEARDVEVQNAKDALEVSRLRNEAKDVEGKTAEERLAAILKANRIEEQAALRNKKMAEERLRIASTEAEWAENTAETNEELARLQAEVYRAEKEYHDKSRELKEQENTLRREIDAERKEAVRKDLDLAIASSQARQKLAEDELTYIGTGLEGGVQERLRYEAELFEVAQSGERERLSLQVKSGEISRREYVNALNELSRASRQFYADQSKELNRYVSQTIDAVLEAAGLGTDAQIKAVEEQYAEMVRQVSDMPIPIRLAGMSDEQYAKELDEYYEFIENKDAILVALEQEKQDKILKLRRDAQEKEFADYAAALDEEYAERLVKAADNERARLNIENEMLRKQIEERRRLGLETYNEEARLRANNLALEQLDLNTALIQTENNAKAQYDIRRKYLEKQLEASQNNADEQATIQKQLSDLDKEYMDQRIASLEEFQSSVNEKTGAINDLLNAIGEARTQAVEEQYAKEDEALRDKLNSGLISQEEYDAQVEERERKKEKELARIEREKAIRERILASFNIALDTAQAIMKSVAAVPLAGGLPFSAVAAAMGAVQLATVWAQPLPQAAKGKYIQGPSHTLGGVPIEVEGGEAVINKRSTSAFLPLLSAINQAGGGIPFVKPGTDGGYAIRSSLSSSKGMTRADMEKAIDAAFSKVHIAVAVEDIRREDKKYADIESNGTF